MADQSQSSVAKIAVPTVFDLCVPRADVLKGGIAGSDFAADLAQVIRGQGPPEYLVARDFFADTYPTRGLKNLLANVCGRLSGSGGDVAAIFRLDTSYGGGKTHALIALVHAARGMKDVANIPEFVQPAILPKGKIRVAAFDGENADPANGRAMGDGVLAFTPWGEIAYALAGKVGYDRVRRSDERMIAPGAETLRELFGGEPTLILLDELSVYLRKVQSLTGARDQLTAFLTSLFKAVEGAPRVSLVYTLAIGKEGQPIDAYAAENQFIADRMAEAESVSARKATLLNPTEDDETVKVIRRRLFEKVDESGASVVIEAYRALWNANRDSLYAEATRPEAVEAFRASYPLHPEVLETLTSKTATLSNFQRVRGMLRLLARTVGRVWAQKPADATAVHLHHVDLGYEPIRQEIVTRLGQSHFVPAMHNDITAHDPAKKALAQEIDETNYGGLPPYATYVARTILMHSLAFNEGLKGISPERLRYSVISPIMDVGFIEDACKRFIGASAYLDDRPTAPMRFLAEANLTQIIRRQEQHVDPGQARAELNDQIKVTFNAGKFHMVPFPGGPFDVPDEVGDGRPLLLLISYDGVSVGGSIDSVPDLVARIFERKGSAGTDLRSLRNNLLFVLADEARKDEMRAKMFRRLALIELKKAERIGELAEHQQAKVRELESKSLTDLSVAIQQCYRHVFYPSRNRIGTGDVDLAHTAIDIHSASESPGWGQRSIVRALRELKKLRLAEDEPDSPTYIRDRTPLKKGQMTTLALRDEFRKDPALAILADDDIFVRAVRRGVEQGEYVYRRGDLLYGKGDPGASVIVDEQSIVFTMAYALQHGIWPRKPTPAPSGPAAPGQRPVGGPAPGAGTGPQAGVPTGPAQPQPGQQLFTAEGVLKEALTKLWEQARASKAQQIAVLSIRMFDATDAFRLLGAVGAVSGAAKTVTMVGGYATTAGGEMQIDFRGPVDDARPVKEFLDPQLRAAKEQTLEASFELRFETGLPLAGDAPEKLTERLVKFASGAAYVSATAEVKQ